MNQDGKRRCRAIRAPDSSLLASRMNAPLHFNRIRAEEAVAIDKVS